MNEVLLLWNSKGIKIKINLWNDEQERASNLPTACQDFPSELGNICVRSNVCVHVQMSLFTFIKFIFVYIYKIRVPVKAS